MLRLRPLHMQVGDLAMSVGLSCPFSSADIKCKSLQHPFICKPRSRFFKGDPPPRGAFWGGGSLMTRNEVITNPDNYQLVLTWNGLKVLIRRWKGFEADAPAQVLTNQLITSFHIQAQTSIFKGGARGAIEWKSTTTNERRF